MMIELPEWLFWSGMIAVVLVSLLSSSDGKKKEMERREVVVEVGNRDGDATPGR